jgi:hypothetical protein
VSWFPEAHCYLRIGEYRVDLTTGGPPRTLSLLHEEAIDPEQVDTYKVALHQRFIAQRAAEMGCQPEALWAVREACIAAM